jgi:hypothetical protein
MDGGYGAVVFEPDDAAISGGKAIASLHVSLEKFGKPI